MSLSRYSDKQEVGCDEAGRGCLAGPVIAAAVILPKNLIISELNDSKKLSEKKRLKIEKIIKSKALAYSIGIVSAKEIDKLNILNASFLAMHRALEKIDKKFKLILIDGPYFNKFKNYTHRCIIRGDSKIDSIAAASVLAKNTRDKLMIELSLKHNNYEWHSNKGYPTFKHREAIKKFGICYQHRKSFKLL
jgi:ribonuclease HII